MSIEEPIDVNTAVSTLGFTVEGYFGLMMMFEETTLMKIMDQIRQALDEA